LRPELKLNLIATIEYYSEDPTLTDLKTISAFLFEMKTSPIVSAVKVNLAKKTPRLWGAFYGRDVGAF
jgi:hypothetical protein